MTDFTKTTNFTAKDALTTGDPNKVIKGSDHDTEYDNIATSSATKSNKIIGGSINNVIKQTAGGDLDDAGYSFSGLVGDTAVTKAELDKLDGLTATTAELNILDGVTATTAELNKMDGVTATTAELNYTDGVTSNIQTQLNSKYGSGGTDVAVADGGTGSSTAAGARTNLGLGSLAVESTIGADNLDAATAGDYLEHAIEMSGADVDAAVGTSYAKILEIRIARAGTYRIRSSAIGTTTGSDNGFSQVYKNGVAFGTAQNGISRVTKNEDLAFAAGDLVQLYAKTQLASQIPDGPFYLMVMTGNPLIVASTYSAQGYP